MFFKHLVFVISVLSFVHSKPSCGENEVYTNCMSPCKLQHCEHLKHIPDCDTSIKCQPGCECIENFLRNSDNVCVSSEICEEGNADFDPETDTDIILNESDDETTNEDQVFGNTVLSKNGLTKETKVGSEMVSNTEEVEKVDEKKKKVDAENDDQETIGIEDYLSFKDELKNGDWVIEETEHNDTNQEPNTDQKVSSEEEIQNVDNNENIEQSKQTHLISAPPPTFSSDQQKLSDEKSEVDTEISTEKQNAPTQEKKVEPTANTITPNTSQGKISATELNKFSFVVTTTEKYSVDLDLRPDTENLKPEEIESNRIEPNKINIDDKNDNTKVDQHVDETLETSTLPEKDELPIKRPVTKVYPADKNNTNQWRKRPTPWDGEEPYTTSRPEQTTRPWSPYPPRRGTWQGSNRHTRPRPRKNPITVIYPPIFIQGNSNHGHTYPEKRHNNSHKNKPCSCNTKPQYERNHGRNREHDREREHEQERNREHGQERNHEHGQERNREHERNGQDRNREHGHDRERENERNREHGHDREGGHEHERNRESERRREHERDREPERRREHEQEDKDYDRPSHRRPITWCRRYPGDRRRPCNNRPILDSRPDYKNREHNSNPDRSYERPKRICRSQRFGKPICYVPKSHKRYSQRN